MSKAHPHFEIMANFAEIAAVNDKPWEHIQMRIPESNMEWMNCPRMPDWNVNVEYRIKPYTVELAGVKVQLPITEAPEAGTIVYIPNLFFPTQPIELNWSNSETDKALLQRNMVNLEAGAAIAWAYAFESVIASVMKQEGYDVEDSNQEDEEENTLEALLSKLFG